MANDFINIEESGTPTKKLASQSFTRTGPGTVHQEEVVIGDGSTDGRLVAVTASNALKVDGSAVVQPINDNGGALTVDALDLDIRNLTHVASQDSVRIGDGTDLANVTAAGELNVLPSAQPGVDIGDVTVNNAGGASAVNVQDGGNVITVDDPSLDNATLVDNNAFADGTTRLVMAGHIFDDVAGTALTENDAAASRIDSKRSLIVTLEDGTTRNQKLAISAGGAASVAQATASNLNAQVVGELANDAVDSGNPIKVGGLAKGSVPTAVADADRVNQYHDREGRIIVRPWGAGDWTQVHFPASNTVATTSKAAGGANVRHVCTGITAVLAGGTTAPAAAQVNVALRDGATGAGTIVWQAVITLPATAGAMNGISRSGLFIRGTANTAMTLEFSAAGGANTFESVSMEGISITES